MAPSMTCFKIAWLLEYFPCHDHRIAPEQGPYTENDYWFLNNTFSIMHGEIGRK